MGNLIVRRVKARLIVDASGSMAGRADDVRRGHAGFIQSLCEVEASSPRVSCTVFSDEARDLYTDVLPVMVPPFDYQPDGGTLLYDTVGTVLSKAERTKAPTDRMVIVIMTDGHDTDSVEWSLPKVRARIKALEATGDWTFLFFGDDLGVGASMGFKPENIHPFTLAAGGVKAVFAQAAHEIVGLLTSGT